MTYALEINQLHKIYDNGFEALKGISLKVEEGDFFALLGPNGAGKSTTLGVVCSLVNKTKGSVKVFGHDLDIDVSKAKCLMGVVPQEFNFNMFEKVQDVVVQQAGYYGIARDEALRRTEQLLKQLSLWDKRDDASRNLSGGMKRRLMIARALVHRPKLLILDEPTAGVDIELRRSMWEFLTRINEQGTTIILTTHYLEEAENLCRNIAIIDQGDIIQNSPMRELLKTINTETIVLELQKPLAQAPQVQGYRLLLVNDTYIEVILNQGQDINSVFVALSAAGIQVTSMRNKTNRLEELFVNLVTSNKTDLKGVSA
ncbi:ABC transporter ATP-binding protein [Candidatus Njordibacter sp. Uisw_039]|jgi:ABC-2 type transport system ATP-binding protein|uniref:ABC transporter ATP-binding protein n=1 Tax=Candidatus Njordibacter sp. Uisw_039 TaxID=3230972 RepID=UPI003A2EBF76|tara:strand:- start:2220 stop:3161 length:942 start_codon:yes stop_codon:yes gene_type:complete